MSHPKSSVILPTPGGPSIQQGLFVREECENQHCPHFHRLVSDITPTPLVREAKYFRFGTCQMESSEPIGETFEGVNAHNTYRCDQKQRLEADCPATSINTYLTPKLYLAVANATFFTEGACFLFSLEGIEKDEKGEIKFHQKVLVRRIGSQRCWFFPMVFIVVLTR